MLLRPPQGLLRRGARFPGDPEEQVHEGPDSGGGQVLDDLSGAPRRDPLGEAVEQFLGGGLHTQLEHGAAPLGQVPGEGRVLQLRLQPGEPVPTDALPPEPAGQAPEERGGHGVVRQVEAPPSRAFGRAEHGGGQRLPSGGLERLPVLGGLRAETAPPPVAAAGRREGDDRTRRQVSLPRQAFGRRFEAYPGASFARVRLPRPGAGRESTGCRGERPALGEVFQGLFPRADDQGVPRLEDPGLRPESRRPRSHHPPSQDQEASVAFAPQRRGQREGGYGLGQVRGGDADDGGVRREDPPGHGPDLRSECRAVGLHQVSAAQRGQARFLQVADADPDPPGAGDRPVALGQGVQGGPVAGVGSIGLRTAQGLDGRGDAPRSPLRGGDVRPLASRPAQCLRTPVQRGGRQQAFLHFEVPVDHRARSPPGAEVPGERQQAGRRLAGLRLGRADESDRPRHRSCRGRGDGRIRDTARPRRHATSPSDIAVLHPAVKAAESSGRNSASVVPPYAP